MHYLQLAVEQHSVEAYFRLGNCFLLGRGITKSRIDAISMYRYAAAADHVCARIKLAFLLTAESPMTSVVVDEVLELWTTIVQSLQPYALANRPTLAIILPIPGVALTCTAPFVCRLHFVNIATSTVFTDSYEIVVDLEFVFTAAPVLMAGFTLARLAQILHNVPIPPQFTEMVHFVHDPSSTGECNYEGFVYTETCEATLQVAYRAIETVLADIV